MSDKTRRRIWCGGSLLLFVGALLVLTILFWDRLTDLVSDPDAFRELTESMGWRGKLLFLGATVAQVVLAIIPGDPFEIAAGYCFGVAEGTALALIASVIGSAINFLLARAFGVRTVTAFYPPEKIERLSFLKASKRQNFLVFLLYLVPSFPKDMLCYVMGLTEMRFGTFMLISTVGRFPAILAAAAGGAAVQERSLSMVLLFGAMILFLLLVAILFYRYRANAHRDLARDGFAVRYYESVASTNRVAAKAAKKGCAEFYTVAAQTQTAGRGRLSRAFDSPVGGTYMSVVLRPDFPLSEYGKITPYAAVAVRESIAALCGAQTKIKWVNDLLLDGKKVCGILAESGTDKAGNPYVVLGIGINTGTAEFGASVRDIAAHIPFADCEALIFGILSRLSRYREEIATGAWLAPYRANAAYFGESVTLTAGETERTATVLDVTDTGALLVRYEDGTEEALVGGEISLRPTQNRT